MVLKKKKIHWYVPVNSVVNAQRERAVSFTPAHIVCIVPLGERKPLGAIKVICGTQSAPFSPGQSWLCLHRHTVITENVLQEDTFLRAAP